MSTRLSRRGFLKGGAVAGVTILANPWSVRAYAENGKVRFANVGVDGRGGGHLGPAASENLVAICDVDAVRLKKVADKFPDAKPFRDWREMFAKMADKIDGVFVATPDHMHFPIALKALQLKKHVYCEKPLTHGIWEARKLAEEARKAKVATQMGNQGHSNQGWRILCEYIWSGAVGKVTEVHCWTNRPIWPQGLVRPPYTDPVPEHLNWDHWLGVAPERPFVDKWREGRPGVKDQTLYHHFRWRGWWDFGVGALGDMACHIMDGAFWALKLGEAKTFTVEAQSEGGTADMLPNWSIITFHYPARGDMPPCKVVWYDGGKEPPKPPEWEADRKLDKGGYSFFYGENATMVADCYGGSVSFVPASKRLPKPEETIPRVKGHHADFIAACKGGPPASSNFDYAGPFTEMILVGNLALRLGKKIAYDVVNMKATNAPEADALIRRPYRKGWVTL